jgi:hypothetical protein
MICVKCEIDLVPHINGIVIIDMAYDPPEPQAVINSDMWTCPVCGFFVLAGMGQKQYDEEAIKYAEEYAGKKLRAFENIAMKTKYYQKKEI